MMYQLFTVLSILGLSSAVPTSGPTKRWYPNSVGANYFQTNNFDGNQLVSSYIMPDGSLKSGTACWTNGNGSAGINDPEPYENHPDPHYASGSVIVVGSQVLAVNAGSDTFSTFNIPNDDPARPTFQATYPTGQFPISLGASPDGSVVCALNSGADNGFKCYSAMNGCEWQWMQDWDRSFGLNLTTPPHGPVGGTPSQIIFASDMSFISVVIKGKVPTDLNNPTGNMTNGGFWQYALTKDSSGAWQLAEDYTAVEAPLPFSINEDFANPGTFMASDVAMGYDVAMLTAESGQSKVGVIPNQAASCWVAQSKVSGNFYTVDIGGLANVTEVSINPSDLTGMVVSAQSVGVNASATDASVFNYGSVDWMFVNAPAYKQVVTYSISGPGSFWESSRLDLMSDMPEGWVDMGSEVVGQAVYYKWW